MKQLIVPYFLGVLFILISVSACVSTEERSATEEAEANSLGNENNIAENEQLLHYWDNFNVADTVALNNPDVGEQAFVDFIARFPSSSDTIAKQAISNLFAKTDQKPVSRRYFVKQFEHYFYDANSPMRNDAYYQLVLEVLMQRNSLDEADWYRLGKRLELVKKNKVGEKALNFKVELVSGEKVNLYDISAPFTLLFFYEPGCSHCEEIILKFQDIPVLQNLVSQNKMKVLAVYTAGDRAIWKGYQSHIPKDWINGSNRKRIKDSRTTLYLFEIDISLPP